jgi:multisubunit Na+/H+ antiporter MnhF subunit
MANFLQDDKGNNSSMRLLVAFIVVSILGTWVSVSIRTNAMAPLDLPTVLALVGSLMAKAYQKEKENVA